MYLIILFYYLNNILLLKEFIKW